MEEERIKFKDCTTFRINQDYGEWECTSCDMQFDNIDVTEFNYCPNCGRFNWEKKA